MDNKIVKLQVLDKKVEEVEKEEKHVTYPTSNVSNPIYKQMLEFHHTKIGEKFSVKDILR